MECIEATHHFHDSSSNWGYHHMFPSGLQHHTTNLYIVKTSVTVDLSTQWIWSYIKKRSNPMEFLWKLKDKPANVDKIFYWKRTNTIDLPFFKKKWYSGKTNRNLKVLIKVFKIRRGDKRSLDAKIVKNKSITIHLRNGSFIEEKCTCFFNS